MKSRWAVRHPGLATLCLLMSSCAFSASIHSPTNLVSDKAGLALNQERLPVAVDDLNAVADPSHTHTKKPAASYGCSMDSGEAFEPEATQVWTLTRPARDDTDPISVDAAPLRPTPLAQQAMQEI